MATLFEQFILGLIQGIFEWIPISSEGILILVQSNFFNNLNLDSMLKIAFLLHLGTFFAALIYFRKDVKELLISLKSLKDYKHSTIETKKLLNFLIISTIVSGIIGFAIYKFVLNPLILIAQSISLQQARVYVDGHKRHPPRLLL